MNHWIPPLFYFTANNKKFQQFLRDFVKIIRINKIPPVVFDKDFLQASQVIDILLRKVCRRKKRLFFTENGTTQAFIFRRVKIE
jgi:hypothetical protein